MRDSALKRTLVSTYFSALEVRSAIGGMVRTAAFGRRLDYDAYWQQRGPSALQPRFSIIAAALRPGQSVLDIGCGDGAMLEHFARTRGVRGVGVDVSSVGVALAQRRGVDARLDTTADLLRTGETFDHVVLSEVIEHVADAERLALDAWALTRRSLWITFPNIAYFPHRLRLMAGKFPVQWAIFPAEHLRFWSASDFPAWLRSLDFPAPKLVASNGVTFARLHRIWPNLFGNQIVARLDR
jgi:methionine biosynthesis protein MetW